MLAGDLVERVLGCAEPGDELSHARVLFDAALQVGDQHLAAAAIDRAYALAPGDGQIVATRRALLDALSVTELGLNFRYIPAGSFLMGSVTGDLDEQPVHAVRLTAFWLTDTAVTWDDYCRLMKWPKYMPPGETGLFTLSAENRIRSQYCNPRDVKPMVAVSWQSAEELANKISSPPITYGLPTEAQWERAARGGLIGQRYSWGELPPDPTLCDFDHFGDFTLRAPRELPPNGYGLYGMCGGVWEWTRDPYDSLAYHPRRPPAERQKLVQRVLRGGSFTDSAEAVTVSFRMASQSAHWRTHDADRADQMTPNIGFRLLRAVTP